MFDYSKNQKGMTLIEVVAALLILGMVLIPISSLFVASNMRARQTILRRQALVIGEAYLEELRQEDFLPVMSYITDGQPVPDREVGLFVVKTESEVVTIHGTQARKIIIHVAWENDYVELSTLYSPHR